ncbi:AhpC/TSA family protein [Mucilaginibacter mali]|uniref:AhpC/TSA family protein n=1 Tax=Mucilaginibacter mali TaxID=2740462 RepID=A0A7D4QAL0_9SPHI|nr:AhpC/TSA family protein [Mucilaginibacter mali]QKJ30885.1 AhpC/TSA family protein [Mucilaginibacter mali]
MNKRIILYSAALLTLVIASCKDKNAFTISGTLSNPGKVKKVYLLEADSTRINMVDSINLSEDNKFEIKHTSPFANLYKLRIGSSIYDVIAQNGEAIEFKTDLADTTHTYTISGSDESGKIQEFNKLSNLYGDKTAKIANEYQAKAEALGHESDSLMSIYRPRFIAAQSEYGAATLKFVNDNKKSLAALYAALSLDQNKYEQQLVAYADEIKGTFAGNPAALQFVKQMELAKPISVGHKAPEFSIADANGKQIKLSDYKGKYVMLDFWASWCGPCRAEMPNVVKQYAAFKGKGLNILGISLDEEKGAWLTAAKQMNMGWEQASDLQKWGGATERLYHIEAIPANFIIDPQGNIVAKNLAGADLEDFLKKTFNKGE